MTYHYQKLGPTNLEAMRDLLRIFGEAFGEPRMYRSAQPRDSYLHKLLGQSHFIAMAAMKENEVVGGLTAYVLEKFEQELSEIYLYDLAVVEQHRRKGIASALIRHLQKFAQSCQAWVIFVQADRDDTPAMNLYASLGKREDVYHFDIPVA
jgi:aminoglycoside 3-N-acetyltransferase I